MCRKYKLDIKMKKVFVSSQNLIIVAEIFSISFKHFICELRLRKEL